MGSKGAPIAEGVDGNMAAAGFEEGSCEPLAFRGDADEVWSIFQSKTGEFFAALNLPQNEGSLSQSSHGPRPRRVKSRHATRHIFKPLRLLWRARIPQLQIGQIANARILALDGQETPIRTPLGEVAPPVTAGWQPGQQAAIEQGADFCGSRTRGQCE